MTRSPADHVVRVISNADDLDLLVTQINDASWDDANEMSVYSVNALEAYLERQDTVFLACHESSPASKLLGIASGRLELKPYEKFRWLYVDEVDVCADERQRGVGRCLMNALLALAEENDCEELWLGTEADNHAANALYRSLEPDDIAEVVGYTFEFDD